MKPAMKPETSNKPAIWQPNIQLQNTCHHSPVNLHRSFTVVVSFSNAKINIIWQKRSKRRAFTCQYLYSM